MHYPDDGSNPFPPVMLGSKIEPLMRIKGIATLKDLAEEVRRRGAPNVQYQHLQQLIAIPSRMPRYIRALAAAFGMTIEELFAWEPSPDISASLTQTGASDDLNRPDNGGSAFPQVVSEQVGEKGHYHTEVYSVGGVSVLDYFAAKAMQPLLAQATATTVVDSYARERIADDAYLMAEAMLEARKQYGR